MLVVKAQALLQIPRIMQQIMSITIYMARGDQHLKMDHILVLLDNALARTASCTGPTGWCVPQARTS